MHDLCWMLCSIAFHLSPPHTLMDDSRQLAGGFTRENCFQFVVCVGCASAVLCGMEHCCQLNGIVFRSPSGGGGCGRVAHTVTWLTGPSRGRNEMAHLFCLGPSIVHFTVLGCRMLIASDVTPVWGGFTPQLPGSKKSISSIIINGYESAGVAWHSPKVIGPLPCHLLLRVGNNQEKLKF